MKLRLLWKRDSPIHRLSHEGMMTTELRALDACFTKEAAILVEESKD